MNLLPETEAQSLTRRHFFGECGYGVGKLALAGLLTNAFSKPQGTHFASKAKRVIHLMQAGAPSHLELFDNKPKLKELEGKPLPPSVIGDQRYAFIQRDAAVLGPRFPFARHGQSGAELSDKLPHLAKVVDEVAIIKSMHSDQFNHAPGQIFFNTGFAQPGRPSLGSWLSYGLGAASDNLPAFVVMSTGGGISGGSALWSAGFMPGKHAGVRFRNSGDPILNVSNPIGVDNKLQRDSLDLIGKLNRRRLEVEQDPEIATRIESYEMAFRLQTSAPELMDLKSERPATLKLYGADPTKPSYGRACLLARRMVERGVRYVQLICGGWDAHGDVKGNHETQGKKVDKPIAGLISDLHARGLLESTQLVWVGEFGRTPRINKNGGRDHWPPVAGGLMMGGGMRTGQVIGSTNRLGEVPKDRPVNYREVLATLYQLMGIDVRSFTLPDLNGRPQYLVDHAPISEII